MGIGGRLRDAARVGAWALEQGAGILRTVAGEEEKEPSSERPDPQRDTTPKDFDDVTIARKVESVIFRPRGRPKDTVSVNVVDGVVWLRGTARSPEMIRRLEAETRAIPEVVGVQNLLHLPQTPAPSRTDTPAPMRKTRSRREPPAAPRREPRTVSADKTIAQGEPLPEELARQRRGRPASPLGGSDDTSPGAGSEPPAA